jgi:hypothetical protein
LTATSLSLKTSVSAASADSSGAALSCGQPDLEVNAEAIYWRSITAYVMRSLSVDYKIVNSGAGAAVNVVVSDAVNTSGVTSNVSGARETLGDIDIAGSSSFTVNYMVPFGVWSFKSTLYATAEDSCGEAYEFPVPGPGLEEDLSYAIVDTGQSACYESSQQAACPSVGGSYYGQDAQYVSAAPSYISNGDGTVTDNVTALMWQQDPGEKMTYAEAVAAADSFSLGGYGDWRLPTIKELYSIIDFSGLDPSGMPDDDTSGLVPFIDTDYFAFEYGDPAAGERIIDAQFVSSTEYVSTTMNNSPTVFGVNFADGRIKGYPQRNKTYFVLFVRGNGDYGENRFVDNGDGTVTDHATGLMWLQGDSGDLGAGALNWQQSLSWAENLDYAGHSDWRLPDAKELQSIVDYSRSPDTTGSAAIDPVFSSTAIINESGVTDYPFYWSSTTHANMQGGGNAAYVAFGRALGYMNGQWIDVHGAGAQRSDPKSGDPGDWPYGHGPQGDAIRINNYARAVRTADVSGGGEIPDQGVFEGYNLFAPQDSTTTFLMDNEGNTVHSWASAYRPGNSVYLLEDGNLLRTGTANNQTFSAGGSGGIVQMLGPDGDVVWEYDYSSSQYMQHHDVEMLPNGNVLLIAWEYRSEAEALQAGRNPARLDEGELWPDTIIEIQPTGPDSGTIVWEWRAWDHLVQDYSPSQDNYGVVAEHPELIDLNYGNNSRADMTHINSLDYNSGLDQILLSGPRYGEVWIIDHSTTTAEAAGHSGGDGGNGGDLLYRWGNQRTYGAGTVADKKLFAQHDAEWIGNGLPGEGNILLFNNGNGRPDGSYSTVEELVTPVDSQGVYGLTGSAYGPDNALWTYSAANPTDLYADHISGAQRLPNGNTLICDGPAGYFFEVTGDGEVIWEYDYGSEVFRVERYAVDYPGLAGLL